ncbi:MAG: hypothetical protein AAF747_02030 [Planctomycetota bacterium]
MKYQALTGGLCGGGIVAVTALALGAGQLGPLDPPEGPVTDTSPSLADVDAKLDAIIASQGDCDLCEFEVFNAPATGPFLDQFESVLVAPGRVYVKSVTVHFAVATLFSGAGGEVNTSGQVISGDVVGRSVALFTSSGNGRGGFNTSTVELETVVEDGLWVAWDSRASTDVGFVTVVYKMLDD